MAFMGTNEDVVNLTGFQIANHLQVARKAYQLLHAALSAALQRPPKSAGTHATQNSTCRSGVLACLRSHIPVMLTHVHEMGPFLS